MGMENRTFLQCLALIMFGCFFWWLCYFMVVRLQEERIERMMMRDPAYFATTHPEQVQTHLDAFIKCRRERRAAGLSLRECI